MNGGAVKNKGPVQIQDLFTRQSLTPFIGRGPIHKCEFTCVVFEVPSIRVRSSSQVCIHS